MKFISSGKFNGKTTITVERGVIPFLKWKETYLAQSRCAGEFYEWVKMPGHSMVGDIQFQLNKYKKAVDDGELK